MAAYQRELDFFTSVLEKMRLPVHIVRPGDSVRSYDEGLRSLLDMAYDYENAYHVVSRWAHERTVYKIVDQFMCNYIYFHLPGGPEPAAVVIGPYLTVDPSRAMLLEQTERLGLPMHQLDKQAEYYASLPVFNDPSAIMAVVTTLGERLWGGTGAFDMVDVNYEQHHSLPASASADTPIEQADILQQMRQMEERYAYENELMDIVAKGLTHRAEVMMSSVSQLNYQQRLPDPLRNMKNYCIICNTLLRKAAQQGGVHPIHLDKMSSHFARTIETAPSLEQCSALIGDMIRAYCRLVRVQTGQNVSPPVQKVLTYIDANLSGDLSLSTLAGLLGVTPGYLSTLFHRETGHTLAQHITEHRMKAALQLLTTTRLQVQTIAQLCGFADPNYFGKTFRRFYGVTPLQYRWDNPPSA